RTRRAAQQRVLLLPAVEPVRRPQPLLRARLPANRARLRTLILGPGPVLAVCNPSRPWTGGWRRTATHSNHALVPLAHRFSLRSVLRRLMIRYFEQSPPGA